MQITVVSGNLCRLRRNRGGGTSERGGGSESPTEAYTKLLASPLCGSLLSLTFLRAMDF